MIDLSQISQVNEAKKALSSLQKRRSTKEPRVVLRDGPMAGHECSLEFYEKIMVFTNDRGAYRYVRVEQSEYCVTYEHLTPEREEQLQFDRDLQKVAAMLDNPDGTFRWVLDVPYRANQPNIMRDLGFRWDWTRREWYLIGSRNAYSKQLQEAEAMKGAKLRCEPNE